MTAQTAGPPRSRAAILGAVLCGVVFGGILLAYQRLGVEDAVDVAPVEEATQPPVDPGPPENQGPPVDPRPPENPGPPENPRPPVDPRPPEPPPPPPTKTPKTKNPTARATGDATSVVLRHNPDVFDVGGAPVSVPPNDYEILASFDGASLLLAGRVTLKAGDVVILECLVKFRKCEVDK